MQQTEASSWGFTNDKNAAFTATLSYGCYYEYSTPPSFKTPPESSLYLNYDVAQTWSLPEVVPGSLPFKEMRFEVDSLIAPFLTF